MSFPGEIRQSTVKFVSLMQCLNDPNGEGESPEPPH